MSSEHVKPSAEAMEIAREAVLEHFHYCDAQCSQVGAGSDAALKIDALIATRLTAAESSLAEARARVADLQAALRKWPSLDCPCCGEEGAWAKYFEDGQPTTCGCGGTVVADGEGAHITIDDSDEECPKCGAEDSQRG